MPDGRKGLAPLDVLVVEDNFLSAALLVKYLGFYGHSARWAGDAEAAARLAAERLPDAALVDVGLPGDVDGCEVARRLRALPGGEHVLIIVVSGIDVDEYRERALAAGVNLVYPKPADAKTLTTILGRYGGYKSRQPAAPV